MLGTIHLTVPCHVPITTSTHLAIHAALVARDAEGARIDPAQVIAQAFGRSPRNLLSSTFGDELHKSNNGRSKIFGVSGKDRSAVTMAGHVGSYYSCIWLLLVQELGGVSNRRIVAMGQESMKDNDQAFRGATSG